MPTDNKEGFYVNRYVKIKTWRAMETEFGLRDDHIDVECSFTTSMEEEMPDDRIIKLENKRIWNTDDGWYSISEEMIEEDYGEKNPKWNHGKIIEYTRNLTISDPAYNDETVYKWYISVKDKTEGRSGYLHSDLVIRSSCGPFETGYYDTKNSAMFAKLRFERLHTKGL